MEAHSAITPAIWGAVGGAAALAIIGFTWGGWVTGSKANELARQQVQTALVEALTPLCVEKFSMARAPQFEFPAQMRKFAERNVEQARAACGQCMDAAGKAQGVIRTMLPENSLTVGIKQVHAQALGFARQYIAWRAN